MPPKRDAQMVNPDGSRLEELPEGMTVRRLTTHVDGRGSVVELFDERWSVEPRDLMFAYAFTIRPGMAKGWGVHREHEDRYGFLRGELELAFFDAREDSATGGREFRLVLSEYDRCLLVIPRGVWHAERNIGSDEVLVVNFPSIPYAHERPDKYRLPLDTDELPVRLGPGWRGW